MALIQQTDAMTESEVRVVENANNSYLKGLADAAQADADIAITEIGNGWISANETWTYASADSPTFTFEVTGDVTTKYSIGMRVRLTQTTIKYFIITAISYSSPSTTITVYGGTDYTLTSATITDNCYSNAKAPFGFPLNELKWQVYVSYNTYSATTSPTQNVWYNNHSASITVPIGLWKVSYQTCIYVASAEGFVTLSEANNTESNPNMTSRTSVPVSSHYREEMRLCTTKTTLYGNIKTNGSGVSSMGFATDNTVLILKAVCAYL